MRKILAQVKKFFKKRKKIIKRNAMIVVVKILMIPTMTIRNLLLIINNKSGHFMECYLNVSQKLKEDYVDFRLVTKYLIWDITTMIIL